MTTGEQPVVIEVRAQAVVVGATEVMGRSMPSAPDSVRGHVRPVAQLFPSQPVDHQEHHLLGVGRPARKPAGRGLPRWHRADTTLARQAPP